MSHFWDKAISRELTVFLPTFPLSDRMANLSDDQKNIVATIVNDAKRG